MVKRNQNTVERFIIAPFHGCAIVLNSILDVFDNFIDPAGLEEFQLIIQKKENFGDLDANVLRALAQKCTRIEKLAITNGNDLDNQPKSLLVETFANIIMNLSSPEKLKCLWVSNMTNEKDEYMEAILGNLIHFKVFNIH